MTETPFYENIRKNVITFTGYRVKGISDEQARERTTVSELTLGGLIKHVSRIEADSDWGSPSGRG